MKVPEIKIPNKPTGKKKLKDPILLAGKWEEREPIPPTAGTTYVDVKDPDTDPEEVIGKAGIPFRAWKRPSKSK